MGLLKRFFNQTRKPEGILGALMLQGMNSGHGELADWGFTHLPPLRPAQIVDLGCGAAGALHICLRSGRLRSLTLAAAQAAMPEKC